MHYEIDYPAKNETVGMKKEAMLAKSVLDKGSDGDVHMFPPQVLNLVLCLRKMDVCNELKNNVCVQMLLIGFAERKSDDVQVYCVCILKCFIVENLEEEHNIVCIW